MARKVIVGLVGIALILVVGGYVFYTNMEASYQHDADAKRVYDMHQLAALIEAYKQKTGAYPLADFMMDGQPLAQKRRLVVIITPSSLEDVQKHTPLTFRNYKYDAYQKNGETLVISKPQNHAFMSQGELLATLKKVLGPSTHLPYDPQKIGMHRPNFYQYYLDSSGSAYMVSAALYNPHPHALKVTDHYYKYEIGTSPTGGQHVRALSTIPAQEQEAARAAGNVAATKFASHTLIESD